MSNELSDGEARLLLDEQKRRRRLLTTAMRSDPLIYFWHMLALCVLGLGIWACERWVGNDGGDGAPTVLVLLFAGIIFMDRLDRSVNPLHRRMDALVELLQKDGLLEENVTRSKSDS